MLRAPKGSYQMIALEKAKANVRCLCMQTALMMLQHNRNAFMIG